ncbi:MAG: XdhC family protein [Hylemonella sp.]|nr:XdhC family protein [Hylemonella sp.]MDP1937365.1 XdhC family protein [Hylemonella sp.]
MESLDLRVLADALVWKRAGHAVTLVTVVETWGSAPRPPGALLAVRDDGVVSGSVSGGCVEDDLIARTKAALSAGTADQTSTKPSLIAYGVTKEEAARFGLPCGGTLRLVQEPLREVSWVETLLARTAEHRLMARTLHLATGDVVLTDAVRGQGMTFDGQTLSTVFGPKWRLLLIGAGQLSQAVAQMAGMLDFEVLVCDPREEYAAVLEIAGVQRVAGMPDDVVRELLPDAHTAIVALTHDPKLDDMALLEALKSAAFYVGALGSRRNQAVRRQRLAEHFDLSAEELARLHGPVGLHIGAKTPAEIAVSIVAEIVQVKNAVSSAVARTPGCTVV